VKRGDLSGDLSGGRDDDDHATVGEFIEFVKGIP